MDRADLEHWLAARRDPALAVLEGFHPLKHALRFGAEVTAALTSDRDRVRSLATALAPDLKERLERLPWRVASAEALERRTKTPLRSPVLALARRPAVDPEAVLAAGQAPVVLLEGPAHLGNVGAAVRAAAAAGAAGLLTTGPLDPWHAAALRGSAGLHFALPVAKVRPGWRTARPVVALDPLGEPLRGAELPDDALFVFGSERRGLPADLLVRASRRLALPMRPGVSSLNLATSIAALLYVWRLARGG